MLSHAWLFATPMDYSLPASSVHGILQARILEQVSIPFSRGSSIPKDQTHISCISCIGRQIFYHQTTWEAQPYLLTIQIHDGPQGSTND